MCHGGLATAAAFDLAGNLLDYCASIEALFNCFVGTGSKQDRRALIVGSQYASACFRKARTYDIPEVAHTASIDAVLAVDKYRIVRTNGEAIEGLGNLACSGSSLIRLALSIKVTQLLDVCFNASLNIGRGNTQSSGKLLHLMLETVEISQSIIRGESLDAAKVCTDTAFGNDLHQTDFSSVGNMTTAAQLAGEIAYLNNTNHIAILLTEQSSNALFASLGKGGFKDVRCGSGHDNAVGELFNLLQLFGCNRLEVSEVEAKTIRANIATCLLNVSAKNLAKSSMQDMSARMVARDAGTTLSVNLCRNRHANCKCSGSNGGNMAYQAFFWRLGIDYLKLHTISGDGAGIANLAAHFSVERGNVKHNFALLASSEGINAFTVAHNRANLSIGGKALIANELGCTKLLQEIGMNAAVGAPCSFGVLNVCSASAIALLFHAASKFLFIDGITTFFADFRSYLDGKTVGVMQDKGGRAGKHGAFHLGKGIVEVSLTLTKRCTKALFFGENNALDKLFVLDELGIHVAHKLDDLVNVVGKEGTFDAKGVALHNRATKQTTQNIAATLVGGKNAIGDHKRDRTAVVSDDAKAYVGFNFLAVFLARKLFANANQATKDIGIVVVGYALHDCGDTLKTHTSIDVLRLERSKGTILLPVILGEDAVPELKVAIAVAARLAVRAAAPYIGTLIEIDLRAGATGASRTSAPEVIFFTQLGNMIFWNTKALPDLNSLIIVLENGKVELFSRKPQYLSREFVCPSTHFVFEVLAEAEVAQHFKEA